MIKNTISSVILVFAISCTKQEKTNKIPIHNNITEHNYAIIEIPNEYKQYVNPYIGGIIYDLKVKNLDSVKKNQLIALLKDPVYLDLQKEYLIIRHKLEFLKEDFKRQGELTVENVTSMKKMQKIQSDYFALEGNCKALEKKLVLTGIDPDYIFKKGPVKYVHLYAPSSGIIHFKEISKGKYLENKSNQIFIQTSDKLRARIYIDINNNLNVPWYNEFNLIFNDKIVATADIEDDSPQIKHDKLILTATLKEIKIELKNGMLLKASEKK